MTQIERDDHRFLRGLRPIFCQLRVKNLKSVKISLICVICVLNSSFFVLHSSFK